MTRHISLLAAFFIPTLTVTAGEVAIPDKNLEAALRAVLREPKAKLTEDKLNNVFVLEADKKGIKDLTGLEKDRYEMNVYISELEYEMELAARNLQFEKAAELRDKIKEYKKTVK